MLNGASSAGKSSLATAMQEAQVEPFWHVSSDQFIAAGVLPPGMSKDQAWWAQWRPRFFDGFHRCLPALAHAGNDLIVDHIIEFSSWRENLATLLEGLDVFLVGVHCDLAELDRREQARGDRRAGEGRAHVIDDGIHTFGAYDLSVDSTGGVDIELVEQVLAGWHARAAVSTLFGGEKT